MSNEERIVVITSDSMYEFVRTASENMGNSYSIHIISDTDGTTELFFDDDEFIPRYMNLIVNGVHISDGIAALIVDTIYESSEWASLMKVVQESNSILDSQKALIDDVSARVFEAFRNVVLDVIYIE